MDGVLIDVSRSYRRAIEETVSHFTGREIESGTIQRYKNLGGFSDDWKLTHAIISDAGISVSFGRIVEEFQRRYRGDNWDGFIAEEEPLISVKGLEELSRTSLILGIVTGRPAAEANWTVERLGWKRYFPLVLSKEKQEGREKPDPYPLLRALTILDAAGRKVDPEHAVYVGHMVDDMRSARQAGMWAVGTVPPFLDQESHTAVLLEAGAHYVLDSPDAIVALMDQFDELVVSRATESESEEEDGPSP